MNTYTFENLGKLLRENATTDEHCVMLMDMVVRLVQSSQTDPLPHDDTPAAVTFVYSNLPSKGVGNHCLTSAMLPDLKQGTSLANWSPS